MDSNKMQTEENREIIYRMISWAEERTGKDVSRDGREFCEEPILPDVVSETPYEKAADIIFDPDI